MHDSALYWFQNSINNGTTILDIFEGSTNSKSTECVVRTAKIILSIIKKAGAIKHNKTDFRMLGIDAALLACAVYRLDALKPHQQEQLSEQLRDIVSMLKTIEEFIDSCVQRIGIHQVIGMQADRKAIKRHRRKVADILLGLESSLLSRPAPGINDNTRYHLTEGPSFTRDLNGVHNHPILGRPITRTEGTVDNRFPFETNSTDSRYLNHHGLPHQNRKHLPPTSAHPPEEYIFLPLQICIGTQNTIGIPVSRAPSTIIYDYSNNTTHYGSHNYLGQTVNQAGSTQGPIQMPPQNIDMKHFTGNEIHCWTQSPHRYEPASAWCPFPDAFTSPFELRDDLDQPDFYTISDASIDQQ